MKETKNNHKENSGNFFFILSEDRIKRPEKKAEEFTFYGTDINDTANEENGPSETFFDLKVINDVYEERERAEKRAAFANTRESHTSGADEITAASDAPHKKTSAGIIPVFMLIFLLISMLMGIIKTTFSDAGVTGTVGKQNFESLIVSSEKGGSESFTDFLYNACGDASEGKYTLSKKSISKLLQTESFKALFAEKLVTYKNDLLSENDPKPLKFEIIADWMKEHNGDFKKATGHYIEEEEYEAFRNKLSLYTLTPAAKKTSDIALVPSSVISLLSSDAVYIVFIVLTVLALALIFVCYVNNTKGALFCLGETAVCAGVFLLALFALEMVGFSSSDLLGRMILSTSLFQTVIRCAATIVAGLVLIVASSVARKKKIKKYASKN